MKCLGGGGGAGEHFCGFISTSWSRCVSAVFGVWRRARLKDLGFTRKIARVLLVEVGGWGGDDLKKLAHRPWPLVQTGKVWGLDPQHKDIKPPMKLKHVGKDWLVYLSPHYIGGGKWGNRSWWVSFQPAFAWLNHAGNSSGKTLNLATSVPALMFQLLIWEPLLLVVVYFCVYLPALWWSDCVSGFPRHYYLQAWS